MKPIMMEIKMVITLKTGVKAIVYVKPTGFGNDGIGSYEFWGAKQYDQGSDYVEEFKFTKVYCRQKFKDLDEIYDLISDEENERIINFITNEYFTTRSQGPY